MAGWKVTVFDTKYIDSFMVIFPLSCCFSGVNFHIDDNNFHCKAGDLCHSSGIDTAF